MDSVPHEFSERALREACNENYAFILPSPRHLINVHRCKTCFIDVTQSCHVVSFAIIYYSNRDLLKFDKLERCYRRGIKIMLVSSSPSGFPSNFIFGVPVCVKGVGGQDVKL